APDQHELSIDVSLNPWNRSLVSARSHRVNVHEGESTEYEIKVQQGRRVSGQVLDAETQNPVPHVNLFIRVSSDPKGFSTLTSESANTNETGEFECYTLPGFANLSINRADQDGRALPGSKIELTVPADSDPPPVEFQLGHADRNLLRPAEVRHFW